MLVTELAQSRVRSATIARLLEISNPALLDSFASAV